MSLNPAQRFQTGFFVMEQTSRKTKLHQTSLSVSLLELQRSANGAMEQRYSGIFRILIPLDSVRHSSQVKVKVTHTEFYNLRIPVSLYMEY